jgi:hypothetical protein
MSEKRVLGAVVDPEQRVRVERLAEAYELTLSGLLRRALAAYLPELEARLAERQRNVIEFPRRPR